ncbi:MAG: hypothetical protein AB7F98_06380 [Novosphingobium sp.]
MIRTQTTFVIGAGAGCELQLPSGPELTQRIAQSLDFDRFVGDLQTRDSTLLGQYLSKMAARMQKTDEAVRAAADRIRIASKMAPSIDAILDQHNNDPLVVNTGKLAIAYFITQAEARSTLRQTPRIANELPLQGTENWLFQVAKLITTGVPRSQADRCLDMVSFVNFNYDRSLEHFLPFAFEMAFGMNLQEAQRIVAAKLKINRPYGSVGRLPWQGGDSPDCEWASENPWNIHNLATQIRTLSELQQNQQSIMQIQNAVTFGKRLVILGFGFEAQNLDLLFDRTLSHNPEVLVTLFDMVPTNRNAVLKAIKRRTGLERDDLLMVMTARCYETMRDYSNLLES